MSMDVSCRQDANFRFWIITEIISRRAAPRVSQDLEAFILLTASRRP
jgi:hypothetical protein